jgi:hypothetical protein
MTKAGALTKLTALGLPVLHLHLQPDQSRRSVQRQVRHGLGHVHQTGLHQSAVATPMVSCPHIGIQLPTSK